MSEDPKRNLTDKDVEAIVEGLKQTIYTDFKIEVASGILGWVKRALVIVLILLAVQGMSGDKTFVHSFLGSKAQ